MYMYVCLVKGGEESLVLGTEEQMQWEGRDSVEGPEAFLPLEQAAYAE